MEIIVLIKKHLIYFSKYLMCRKRSDRTEVSTSIGGEMIANLSCFSVGTPTFAEIEERHVLWQFICAKAKRQQQM
ncbi:hypothetical protein, partial [Lysinibacillus sp. NPDC096382]|uniref:hypothetical protein n=1 Tax=Lysinibacillus sp. NPDC096382 TaxID=3364136 RepID=UPI0037FDB793